MDCGRDGAYARKVLAELISRDVFVRMPGVAPLDRCIRVSAGTKTRPRCVRGDAAGGVEGRGAKLMDTAIVGARTIVIAYFAASLVAALVGRSLFTALQALGEFAGLAIVFLFGPLAVLAGAFPGVVPGAEQRHPDLPPIVGFAIVEYGICTALLAFCLALILEKRRSVRVLGYSVAAVIWISSVGLPLLGGMYRVAWTRWRNRSSEASPGMPALIGPGQTCSRQERRRVPQSRTQQVCPGWPGASGWQQIRLPG